jgi:hypothetical protein
MARTMLEAQTAADEFKSYVEETVIEALRDGTIAPATLLECVYYAIEPDLFASIKAFAALGPAERLMIMSYAKRLSEETQG